MSFPAYPSYKESGVEWFLAVPANWRVLRARNIGRFTASGIDKKDVDGEQAVKMFNYKDVYASVSGLLSYNENLMVTTAPEDKVREHSVRAGDILLTPSSETSDDIGYAALVEDVPEGVVYSYHVQRYRQAGTYSSRYLTYCFNSVPLRSYFSSVCTGTTRMVLVRNDFNDAPLPVPPFADQTAIASFLERETGKIDELINEQKRLVELLKEKRRAAVFQAVTKGLNPNVPMKASGVDWLGKVPAHWGVKSLRYFAKVLRGKFTHRPRNDPAFYDGRFPFIQTGDITGASRYITEYRQTLNERGAAVSKEFPKGTLVMAIAANVGDVAILDFPAYFPDSIVGLVPAEPVDLTFLYFLLEAMKQKFLMTATVSTQLNLNVDQIVSLHAACPPHSEQKAIVKIIEDSLSQFDDLTVNCKSAIRLLQERRAALIAAAVTGKIDVRDRVPQQVAAE